MESLCNKGFTSKAQESEFEVLSGFRVSGVCGDVYNMGGMYGGKWEIRNFPRNFGKIFGKFRGNFGEICGDQKTGN